MWFSAKAFLNLLLVQENGNIIGKILYKIAIMDNMLNIAGEMEADIEKNFEVIQKLSKRLVKLKSFHEIFSNI